LHLVKHALACLYLWESLDLDKNVASSNGGGGCAARGPPGESFRPPKVSDTTSVPSLWATTRKHSSVGKELREIRELIWELLGVLLSDQLPLCVKRELQNVVQLLQCYLRAAELEMRAAEEPLKADLDVAGLKAQVLERIETLEEQEREREELLSELIPAMESRGYDTQAVKAVMGGCGQEADAVLPRILYFYELR
jgi:uncharacterized protein (UPF0335 family)